MLFATEHRNIRSARRPSRAERARNCGFRTS